MDTLQFKVELGILKPLAEVFDAVIDPRKLARYFVDASSGPLQSDSQVRWRFAEPAHEVAVKVLKVVPDRKILLEWESARDGVTTEVEMDFESLSPQASVISIVESGWSKNSSGTSPAFRNCQGWMHMACCLKAFLEYGVNLRRGSFPVKNLL